MAKSRKSRASVRYESPSQLTLSSFENPFSQNLNPDNRWVILANLIPWDEICNVYHKQVGISHTGRPGLNPRIALGALIIKHLCNLDDRETVDQISENIYMQYFLGYSSFSCERPFDASLFVDLRKRLGMKALNAINEKIVSLQSKKETQEETKDDSDSGDSRPASTSHKGRVIFDATACPQDIAYPTDLNLLSDAREISEKLID